MHSCTMNILYKYFLHSHCLLWIKDIKGPVQPIHEIGEQLIKDKVRINEIEVELKKEGSEKDPNVLNLELDQLRIHIFGEDEVCRFSDNIHSF